MSAVEDVASPPTVPESASPATWVDEMMQRYTNPLAFARQQMGEPYPEVQSETMLTSATGGQSVKLTTAMLKERFVWSKISLVWTFRLTDVEGDTDASRVVVCLVFDSWTGSVQITENMVIKVDEIQRPIVGGSWRTKTDFGELEIKIIPCWTGYEYELWFEGAKVYNFFA